MNLKKKAAAILTIDKREKGEKGVFMKKKIITMLALLVMLTTVFLFTGCVKPINYSNTENNEDSENKIVGKLTIPTYIRVKNYQEKEFSIDEDVTVELYVGTLWSKELADRDGVSYVVDIIAEYYYVGRDWDIEEPDAEVLLLRVEDFYAENYPFVEMKDIFLGAPTFNVALPKTLLLGIGGEIVIKMKYRGGTHADVIDYMIDGDKVILGIFTEAETKQKLLTEGE